MRESWESGIEPDLLATDHKLHAEADELLERKGLRSLLEEYAPIHIAGSYILRLMVWRDLDLLMDAPQITIAEFFELGKRITAPLRPWKMFFTNNRDHEAPRYPRGLYWGVRLGDVKKDAWKIDLWAVDSEQCRRKIQQGADLSRRLNRENRLAILALKSRLWNDPRYRDTVTSQDIYDAVLDHDVKTLAEFWQYMDKTRRGESEEQKGSS